MWELWKNEEFHKTYTFNRKEVSVSSGFLFWVHLILFSYIANTFKV